jgi:hypothetical protein
MNVIPEIREGQVWLSKHANRLKSTGQINIVSINREGMVRIQRFYPDDQRARKDWITPAGLRQRYDLLHDQETLL